MAETPRARRRPRRLATPRDRPAPRGAERRERILVAALELFADRGFEGTTTRDIAARAEVNLGLIQYYFGSKEALWRASVDRVFTALRDELGGAIPDPVETPEQLADVVRRGVRFAGRHPAFVRLMNDEGKRDGPRMRWIVDHHQRAMFELVVDLLRQARRKGWVPDVPPLHLYYILIGAMGMLFSQAPECRHMAGRDPTADAKLINAHAEAVVRTLLPGIS